MWDWLRERQRCARWLRRDWRDVEWVVVDIETNGLDAKFQGILSMAWVTLNANGIDLGSAHYHVIRATQVLNQSVIHHGLTQADIAGGEDLVVVLQQFADALNQRVLVAHNAPFDWRLLRQAATATQTSLSPLAVLDTLALERNQRSARYRQLHTGDTEHNAYTLSACRQRYGLPAKPAHHALEDAVACGELFLAQAWQIAGKQPLSAARLIARG